MALKKSELYSSLWSGCDELRGGMDASQYKDYVLVLLFIKYVSDKYAGVLYPPITIPEGSKFTDMVALKGKSATSGLARMNMILHNNPTALIVQGNTLADPKFKEGDTLKTFDFVVANPPFSDKRWSTGLDALRDPYDRFQTFGTPPARQGGRIALSPQTITAFAVKPGDVLFNRTSETQEEVGLASVYSGRGKVVFGGFVIRARPRNNRMHSKFTSYALRSPAIRSQIVARGPRSGPMAGAGYRRASRSSKQVFMECCETRTRSSAFSIIKQQREY